MATQNNKESENQNTTDKGITLPVYIYSRNVFLINSNKIIINAFGSFGRLINYCIAQTMPDLIKKVVENQRPELYELAIINKNIENRIPFEKIRKENTKKIFLFSNYLRRLRRIMKTASKEEILTLTRCYIEEAERYDNNTKTINRLKKWHKEISKLKNKQNLINFLDIEIENIYDKRNTTNYKRNEKHKEK